MGQLVGQGGFQGIARHRFGQDALDAAVARNDLARRITDAREHHQQNIVVQAWVFFDLGGQLHAGHARHVLVQQDNVEVVAQVRLGAQQGQRFFARGGGADIQAPRRTLLHQYFAARVVVIHHQHAGAFERAVQVGGGVLKQLRVQWQGEPEIGALGLPGLDAELAAHEGDQLAGNDQPQMAAQTGGGEEVFAVQFGVQQCLALLLIHRLARVLNGDA